MTHSSSKLFPGVRMLIVDDDIEHAELLNMFMAQQGASVTLAHTMHAARHHLSSKKYEVLLVDIDLPDGRGTDLLRVGNPLLPNVRILVTGYPEQKHASPKNQAWTAHVVKPINAAELMEQLQSYLQSDRSGPSIV